MKKEERNIDMTNSNFYTIIAINTGYSTFNNNNFHSIGNVEIGEASGSPINKDVTKALDNSIHDPGDDNRNFFGQLRETRLSETVENIAGERLKVAQTRKEIASAFEEAYSDLGYKNVRVIFTTPEHASQLIDENGKPKAGTAYINKKTGEKTIFINENADENQTKTGLIGVIAEEGSHIINGVEGRQIETGTEEKGLESTGRATNEYFQEKYKDDTDKLIIHKSDGIDYSGIDFGENVGDVGGENILKFMTYTYGEVERDFSNWSPSQIRNFYHLTEEEVDRYSNQFASKAGWIDLAIDTGLGFLGNAIGGNGGKIAKVIGKNIGRIPLFMDLKNKFNKNVETSSKDKALRAAAMIEMKRSEIAETEANKDFEYLYGITNKNILIVPSSQHNTVKIDRNLFYKKYPKGDIKNAEKILARMLHYLSSYTSIKGRTNLYVYPGTLRSRNNGGK